MSAASLGSVESAAHRYCERRWLPIPVPRGEKAPTLRGWQRLRLTPSDLERYFRDREQNIGLLLGEPSGGLVDIDLDAPEALAAAPALLPVTQRRHGRAGKRTSHWWYTADPVPASASWKDADGSMLCELRSTGRQTIVPPSVHPSGEVLSWEDDGEPTRVPGQSLAKSAALVAACALLARHWPSRGSRHAAALAAGGFLLRSGLDEAVTVLLVETVPRVAGDEEARGRAEAVRDSAAKLRAGAHVSGGPSLAQLIRDGEPVVALLRRWLGLRADVTLDGAPYATTPEGLIWRKPVTAGSVPVRLTNFDARIVADVVEDDGQETRHAFEIDAGLNSHRARFLVAATDFPQMAWATDHLGPAAVVYAGLGVRDHARVAIQLLSGEPPSRRVYAHLGWRRIGEGFAYIHASGAIDAAGTVPAVEVHVPEALSRFELPAPPAGTELVLAVKASLEILEVAPMAVTVPIMAAIYRAVLGPADFSLHLSGPTGTGKTELVALAQQHFGPALDARHLPASWASTANALEGLAFAAKDALLVVDDFAPQGALADVQRSHRDADRLLRAQGNLAGRQRMRADATLRPPRSPRGLILSTGEDVPRGQSLRARTLVLLLSPGALNWERLTACQRDAAAGRYAEALAGFLQLQAPHYQEVRRRVRDDVAELRQAAHRADQHRRTPSIIADLTVGLQVFLDFAREVGAVTADEARRLWARWAAALDEAAAEQRQHQATGDPAQRFLELLGAAVAAGRAHVAGPDGQEPAAAAAWGWREATVGTGVHERHERRSSGERIGWVKADDLYLDPDAAFAVAQQLGRDGGEGLVVTLHTLKRRLREQPVLMSTDATRSVLTVRRTLEGKRRDVLHLSTHALGLIVTNPDQHDQDDEDPGPWSRLPDPRSGAPDQRSAAKRRGSAVTSPPVVGMVGPVGADTSAALASAPPWSNAPDQHSTTNPTSKPSAPTPCAACRGSRFWRSRFGVLNCATCHPPADRGLVAQWLGVAEGDGDGLKNTSGGTV